MGELSVGTDGGGSVRIPASFCGIVGLKPTHGRIPLFPASPFGPLSHAGPMARSVDDTALLLDVLSMPDHRDPAALAPPVGSFREAVRRDVRGLIAAFSPTLGYVDVDPEVAAIVAAAVRALGDAGLHIEETDPGFADPEAGVRHPVVVGGGEAARHVPAGLRGADGPGPAQGVGARQDVERERLPRRDAPSAPRWAS